MADKNLEEAKKLNQQSRQGNMSNSVSGSDQGVEDAKQRNQQSASSVSNQGKINNAVNGDPLQEARDANEQSASAQSSTGSSSSFSFSSGSSQDSDLESAKKENRKSGQNKGQ
ncbi:MAG TPA: hypothetical protein VHR42_07620 [Clostridia bacterium]|nr:hypothetical protein [Clostridia bacterium]